VATTTTSTSTSTSTPAPAPPSTGRQLFQDAARGTVPLAAPEPSGQSRTWLVFAGAGVLVAAGLVAWRKRA
jgi:LPXTG-motif cell wall-anchored protein